MITIDRVANYIKTRNVTERITQYFIFCGISKKERDILIKFDEYNKNQKVKDTDLQKLSFPQLIVLYGNLWEKLLKPEQIKEVEDLL